MLSELVGDKSLERFRQEYEKLHRALKKSHESEKRLIRKYGRAWLTANLHRAERARRLQVPRTQCGDRFKRVESANSPQAFTRGPEYHRVAEGAKSHTELALQASTPTKSQDTSH